MPRSLLSDMFCGQIRSILRQSGSRESATLEPFFSLPLDIQADKVRHRYIYIRPGTGLLLSRECLSHDTTYFRMSALCKVFL